MEPEGPLQCSQEATNTEALCKNACQAGFLWWGVVRPSPYPQAGGPPVVSCLWLLINIPQIQ